MELLDKTVSQFKDYTIHSIMYSPDQMCEYKPYFNFVNTVEQKSYLFGIILSHNLFLIQKNMLDVFLGNFLKNRINKIYN